MQITKQWQDINGDRTRTLVHDTVCQQCFVLYYSSTTIVHLKCSVFSWSRCGNGYGLYRLYGDKCSCSISENCSSALRYIFLIQSIPSLHSIRVLIALKGPVVTRCRPCIPVCRESRCCLFCFLCVHTASVCAEGLTSDAILPVQSSESAPLRLVEANSAS